MGYAFFGIPITMIMFQSMGERMNKFYTIVIKKYRSCRGRKRTEVSEFDLILASGSTSAGAISLLKISCSILNIFNSIMSHGLYIFDLQILIASIWNTNF